MSLGGCSCIALPLCNGNHVTYLSKWANLGMFTGQSNQQEKVPVLVARLWLLPPCSNIDLRL